jgi:hypothetical protein
MITFCGFSQRSSGIIRGEQLSKRLPGSEFLDVDGVGRTRPLNNTVIYIRKINVDHLQHCKKWGMKTGYDVSDTPVTDYSRGLVTEDDFSRYTHELLDFYIVNNDVVKSEMRKFTTKPIHVVPHHSCNFNRKRNSLRIPRTIGYIGLPEQSIDESSLSLMCKEYGLTFTKQDVSKHADLDEAFSEIDIGLIYFDRDSIKKGVHERILKYKPGTKLTNFQSYGIPTLCLPYESFKQFGGEKCIFVESLDDIKRGVARLVEDPSHYEAMSNESVLHAEKLHIDNVVRYYEEIARL